MASEVRDTIKQFVLEEFLPGENPSELTDDVELMTLGVLDSIGVLKVVAFLESQFEVTFAPHELGKSYLNTLRSITALVLSKRASR